MSLLLRGDFKTSCTSDLAHSCVGSRRSGEHAADKCHSAVNIHRLGRGVKMELTMHECAGRREPLSAVHPRAVGGSLQCCLVPSRGVSGQAGYPHCVHQSEGVGV